MPQTLLTFSVLTVLQDTRFGYNYHIIVPHSFANINEIFRGFKRPSSLSNVSL